MTIEEYLNKLPDNTKYIDISNGKLRWCPSLARFKNLNTLQCQFNSLDRLPEMSDSVENIFCYGNQLTKITKLPRNLTKFYGDYNKLTHISYFPPGVIYISLYDNLLPRLPPLPPNLQSLNCSKNQLNSLPFLPQTLSVVSCDTNRLETLPTLPPYLFSLSCEYNPIETLPELPLSIAKLEIEHTIIYDKILMTDNIYEIREIVNKIHRFRVTYYTLKFKQRFRDLLWLKVRLPKIERVNHPDLLRDALMGLDSEEELEELVDTFGK